MTLRPPSSPETPTATRLAGIDIGSNSIRLIVAEVNPEGTDYRVLDDHKETTRLAHGLTETGRLTAEAMALSLDALRRMKALVDGHQVHRLEAIATSAVREASNGQEFVQLAQAQLGLAIEIISPEEEGRLSFQSVQRRFDLHDQQVLLLDLGGGSGELIFAAHGTVEAIYSLPIGSVRMTEACIRHDPPRESDFKAVRKRLSKLLTEAIPADAFRPHFMIGAGGTFTALANISLRMRDQERRGVGGYEMTRSDVRHVLARLAFLPLAGRRAVTGLHADRADIIVAGLVVIERLMKWMQVNRLVVHDQGVRDGLLLRMIDRHLGPAKADAAPKAEDPETLRQAARQFGASCGLDEAHAMQVAGLSAILFDQLQEPLKLPAEERILLELAAWLHEVGTLINYQKHHRHSYHLIVHGNFRGLTPRQREIVAQVARYHRKAEPKEKHKAFANLN
jgi:exopolyphosphatase/guanosine-5'-triphosphate,3'-diphosphate pyrophosphatase